MQRKPESRRDWVIIAALIVAVVGGSTAAKDLLFSGAASTTANAEASVLLGINKQRSARGLPALHLDRQLANVARSWSETQILTGKFTHGDFEHRLYSAVGRRRLIAEDLGMEPAQSITGVVRAWMNSPPHKANILLTDAHRLGVGVAVGTYQGQGNTAVITADFSS